VPADQTTPTGTPRLGPLRQGCCRRVVGDLRVKHRRCLIIRWLAGLDTPGLTGTWRALAFLGSWWVLNILGFGLLLALLALRRFRHLIVVLDRHPAADHGPV